MGAVPAPSDPTQPAGHILVVDDEPQLRETIQWCLEDEGLVVETAANGQQAVERATRARPALIVLDMGLPVLSGEEAADQIRAAYRGAPPPIVVITAAGHAAEKAKRCGAVAYLAKPFNLSDLARIVLRYMERNDATPRAAD